jgi:hypothetical protein
MPTKPSHKKHGKAYLDEAVAKSTYRKKPITRSRAIKAGILGILLGTTGIHNALMHNKKRGFVHLLYSSTTFGMFFLPLCHGFLVIYKCRHGGECIDMTSYDDTLNALVIAGLILFATSIIWGIVEGVIILKNAKNFPKKTD